LPNEFIGRNNAGVKKVHFQTTFRRYPITAIRFKYAIEAGVSRSYAKQSFFLGTATV